MPRVSLKQTLLEILIRVALPLLGVHLLVAGTLGVVSFLLLPLFEAMHSRQWTPVVATLESARVERAELLRVRPLPALEVRYSYRYRGADFVGSRNDLHHGLDTPAGVRNRLVMVEDGRALTAWVNPDKPAQALLDRSLNWGVMVLAVPAAVLALVGGLLVFIGMVAWNDWRPMWWRPAARARPPGVAQQQRVGGEPAGLE